MISIRRFLFLALFAVCAEAQSKALVLISIDGLANRYLNETDAFHLKIPTLRRLLVDGVHATGVRAMMPTVTYPNHTTLLTGVAPAKHRIGNNVAFDPEDRNLEGWMWYAQVIAVPTLWEVAARQGIPSAA